MAFSVPRRAAIAVMLIVLACSNSTTVQAANQSDKVAAPSPQEGKRIFRIQGCGQCHGSNGEGISAPDRSGGAPPIASTSLTLADFVQLVRHPRNQMPPFGIQKLPDKDLADVYAFLRSVPYSVVRNSMAAVNPENGKLLFKRFGCYECHGYVGQGSTQTGGSRLSPPEIPLTAFVNYVRSPSGQMPPYTTKVVPDQDLADIYSYLQSLPRPAPAETIPLLSK
jgi:mono/diheme cytochrome c family protein